MNEGFRVDEVPLYLPAGEGEHLYLHVEKRGLSTPELISRLRDRFGLRETELGYAGRKDARGVTTQWISVPARKVEPEVADVESLGPVRLLEAKRHGNKLRLGHLKGNRFTVVVEGDVDVSLLESRAARLSEIGFANYFGAQRFGPRSESLREAERYLERRRPPRARKERFLVSVVQSALFNAWLSERVADGLLLEALEGDVLMKPTGASFLCTDPAIDTPRVRAGEVTPAGPLYGRDMRSASGAAMTRESRSLEHSGLTLEDLRDHPAFDAGARRPARVFPEGITVASSDVGTTLSFTLPKGSYATVFLREWCGPRLVDAAFADGEDDMGLHRRH